LKGGRDVTEAFWNRDEYGDDVTMRNDMERFFSRLPHWKKPSAIFEKAWKPLCDVYECPDHFSVIMELAGVSNTHLLEINYGDFERILELPTDIDPDATRAIYRRGFLEIILPKLKREKLRGVDIQGEE
jgi:HSP20 family molecular chaperone IbpA